MDLTGHTRTKYCKKIKASETAGARSVRMEQTFRLSSKEYWIFSNKCGTLTSIILVDYSLTVSLNIVTKYQVTLSNLDYIQLILTLKQKVH